MIIPITLEEDSSSTESSNKQITTSVVPIVTFPAELFPEEKELRMRRQSLCSSSRDKRFGDILLPALSKYLQLRDSKLRDLSSLLVKEHPLQIENFKNAGDKYELQLNVQKFKPEELHVKITDDFISILGEHEEKTDKNNYTKQEFLRRYSLPAKVHANDIKCELSSDGYLMISAPRISEKVKITEIPSLPIHRHRQDSEEEAIKAI